MMNNLERLNGALSPAYELDRTIGRGELGVVYGGTAGDGRSVAVKVLSPDLTDMLASPQAFVDVMRGVVAIRHQYLVPALDAGVTPAGEVYYVMALADGPTGRDVAARRERPNAREIAVIGALVADALSVAHAAGVVHGLIGPADLHWTDEGVKLADLGVHQALLAAGLAPKEVARLVSAPQYMSPELLGGHELDGRSDVYSLGASLYEVLTGTPPFGGRTTSTVMATVLADEPAPLGEGGDLVPGQVVSAVLRAIEKAPDDRWSSAAAFAAALREGGSEASPQSAADRAPRTGCLPAAIILIGWGVVQSLRIAFRAV